MPSSQPSLRDVLQESTVALVGRVAFPRLAHRLRRPTRLGLRGLIAYVAFNTLVLFAIRGWLVPAIRRRAAESEPGAASGPAERPQQL